MGENNQSLPKVSALVSKANSFTHSGQPRQNRRNEKVQCEHCNKLWHKKETCWTLYGKLQNWKPRSSNQTNQPNRYSQAFQVEVEEQNGAGGTTKTPSFSKEQLDQLYKLFKSINFSKNVSSSCSLAQKGNYLQAISFNMSSVSKYPWIIDSSTMDHMIGNPKLFSSCSLCARNQKI